MEAQMIDKDKTYLITGGAGFLGTELISRLQKEGCENIVTISRNEGKLVYLKEKFPHVKVIPGDISDPYCAEKAVQGVDGIFHLAAFKHVGLAEKNVRECVLGNVTGTMNFLELTRKYPIDFILGISTDKAAQVRGVYGATKLLHERLFTDYENLNPNTKYRTVRYGNVLYSTGSVLCKWKDRILNDEELIVTDPSATRFYWSIEQAIDLIFNCLHNATDSSPYVPEMKSMAVGDLMEAMIRKYMPEGNQRKVKEIGLQPGENLHEVIIEGGPTSFDVDRFSIEEIMELV
jgi:UDP-N-acetylglucosamine 4,6-dehydratase/UDP-glucose 4-epimerase|tara:strand:+ start:99 stop:968 length:870 start_codon:yes stop_codon:yes gene_type:complete